MPFNSRQYEWADLTLILGGVDITGFRAIEYKEKPEREALFAKGRYAHSIQTGNVAFDGSITVLGSELDALMEAGGGSITGLALDAEVSYGNAPDPVRTDRIVGIRFTEAVKSYKQGDKFAEHVLPFICLRVNTNV